MTQITYMYTISTGTLNGQVSMAILKKEIEASAIVIAHLCNTSLGDTLYILMADVLSTGDKTILDNLITIHSGDTLGVYKKLVQDAINFFGDIMVEFAAENVTMGITSANKTKLVADYLANVMRYGQSGSLHEVNNEIDVLIAAAVPSDLSPFVTSTRLTDFKQKVTEYLA